MTGSDKTGADKTGSDKAGSNKAGPDKSGANRLSGLKARPKPASAAEVRRIDEVAEARGFLDRTPRRKPGRKPSPRTCQLHPKLFPEVGEAISAEAERLGITQGQLIEMMWELYRRQTD